MTLRTWLGLHNGIEIAKFESRAQDWTHSRRMILVRQEVNQRPKVVGKQLSLFEEDVEINGFRYTCYITTLTLSRADVWWLIEEDNCENCIY